MTSTTSVDVNLQDNEMVILGTQYAGEMKKGVFGLMHYLMPKAGVLSLHSSATEGEEGDTTLLFGLSGTGKTTLSADPKRKLIGDDEHCWSDTGVFNIEGGCYAKCLGLSHEKEPDIWWVQFTPPGGISANRFMSLYIALHRFISLYVALYRFISLFMGPNFQRHFKAVSRHFNAVSRHFNAVSRHFNAVSRHFHALPP
jgi:hypothetical protein